MEVICKNLEQTQAFAESFCQSLAGGDVVVLSGDLGAGKTTFTKFVGKSMGIKEPITSPTYTLLNEYDGNDLKLYHFDMYRIDDLDEVLETGVTEYFGKQNGVCIIEWAENIKPLLPKKLTKITISKVDDTTRKFVVEKIF